MFGIGSGAWLLHRHSVETKLSAAAIETRARAEQGDAAAQNNLGNLYLNGTGVPKDYTQADVWYRKGADQGNPKAQFNLGEMYALGYGVPPDNAKALLWLRRSADQADTRAEVALGHMYFNGQGVTRDEGQGFAWYRKAAEAGHLPAQQFVGWMYYYGRGVQQDYKQAAAWYEKAANQGDAFSQASLGYMYRYGLGVEPDGIGSLRYYRMASAQGEPTSTTYLWSLKPPRVVHRIELGMAVFALVAGLLFVLAILELIVRRKSMNWRHAMLAVLGVAFLTIAALSFYGSAHAIRYSPHRTAFLVTRRTLEAIAVVILMTVVLPAKRETLLPGSAGAKAN